MMVFACDFLFETCTLLEQCTYLGCLILEAPREYVQHGPLLRINWLRLCPQSGARVRSHAVRRRLFILFLMTAAHISPNVFSLLEKKLPQQHTCTIFSIRSPSFILIIHHIQATFTSFYYETIILSFLRLLMAGRLLSVSRVRYSYIDNNDYPDLSNTDFTDNSGYTDNSDTDHSGVVWCLLKTRHVDVQWRMEDQNTWNTLLGPAIQ